MNDLKGWFDNPGCSLGDNDNKEFVSVILCLYDVFGDVCFGCLMIARERGTINWWLKI